MSEKICLVVIFNHQFNRNLPVLRELLGGKFSHVRFLVPFYRGSDPDVIAVYDSSATFQGYIVQAYPHLSKEGYTHFVFTADDLLLNPCLDETNLLSSLTLGPGDAYIQELRPITDVTFHWPFLHTVLKAMRFDPFVNAADQLPDREEALRRLAVHGVRLTGFGLKTLRFAQGSWWWKIRSLLAKTFFLYGSKEVRRVVYPLVMSYSDFLVVPAAVMGDFCHFCGVFTAMRIFVECAIPTALALAAPRIKVERDIPMRGKEVFNLDDLAVFEEKYERRLSVLCANFPAATIYAHPVKLSRWTRD